MPGESLGVIFLVGLIAGWLAGQIMRGAGFGIVGDLVTGIIGAFLGAWLLPRLGIHLGAGLIAAIVNATIGALLLLVIDHQDRARPGPLGRPDGGDVGRAPWGLRRASTGVTKNKAAEMKQVGSPDRGSS